MVEDYVVRTGKSKQESAHEISKILMTRTIVKVGSIGAITSSSSSVPGLGSIAAMLFTSVIDFALVLREQIELCYKVSCAYDIDLTGDELKAITLAIIGFSFTAEAATHISEIALTKVINKMAANYMNRGLEKSAEGVAREILPRLGGRISKYLPFISIPISISINVVSTLTVGKQAIKYFSAWNDNTN
ncbi:MAG: hypothetical protein HQK87_09420 [Nitrospinae bacterium]|nr:hypothetical protein [Nitrospinota bacterium]